MNTEQSHDDCAADPPIHLSFQRYKVLEQVLYSVHSRAPLSPEELLPPLEDPPEPLYLYLLPPTLCHSSTKPA